ncbi:hypothetical protein PR001_g32985, partial [Phytophthora rubi]
MVFSRAVHALTLSSQLALAGASASFLIASSSGPPSVSPTSAQSVISVCISCLACTGFQIPSSMCEPLAISSVISS